MCRDLKDYNGLSRQHPTPVSGRHKSHRRDRSPSPVTGGGPGGTTWTLPVVFRTLCTLVKSQWGRRRTSSLSGRLVGAARAQRVPEGLGDPKGRTAHGPQSGGTPSDNWIGAPLTLPRWKSTLLGAEGSRGNKIPKCAWHRKTYLRTTGPTTVKPFVGLLVSYALSQRNRSTRRGRSIPGDNAAILVPRAFHRCR